MTRRFLTAEDVRRAGSQEIVVDASTVVTPQALEAAALLGVAIRGGAGGEYEEPRPDRGPDAGRASAHLPHLPEPDDDGSGVSLVVTAVGRNRPGVLAEISGALGEAGASIHDISQKMVGGEYFHLILTVQLPPGGSFGALKDRLQCLGGEDDYVVRAMHERVFRFMHRV